MGIGLWGFGMYANHFFPALPRCRRMSQALSGQGFQAWRSAMRWQRSIDAALHPFGLTHARYLVLAAVDELVRELGDAVAQKSIAERAGVDKATTSQIARRLEQRGLLDRGPDGVDSRAGRVFISRRGRDLLRRARPSVDAAAASFFSRPCRESD
jgi:MarR family transcriptional regulator, organic hydroperoxide resistance regulator